MHSMTDSVFVYLFKNSWTRNMLIMVDGAAHAHELMVRNMPTPNTRQDQVVTERISVSDSSQSELFWKTNYGKNRFSWDPAGPRTSTSMKN